MWTRRRTVLDENDTPRDDWIIMRDGQDVGRIYWRVEGTATSPWFWAPWAHPARSGTALTLEDAQEAARKAVLYVTKHAADARKPSDRGS